MKITSPLIISALIANFFIFSCSKDEPVPVDTTEALTFKVEKDLDGNVFVDNETIDFFTIVPDNATLDFYVRNISSETIAMRIEVESMYGTDGSGMELCFGECYPDVTPGRSYPMSPITNVYIEPGQTQVSSEDHFLNSDGGDGINPVEYTFKFYLADEAGNEKNGTAFRIKYKYTRN